MREMTKIKLTEKTLQEVIEETISLKLPGIMIDERTDGLLSAEDMEKISKRLSEYLQTSVEKHLQDVMNDFVDKFAFKE